MNRRRILVSWVGDMVNRHRLLLAGKTALAAAIALFFVRLLPFTDDKYYYYAPLGAVICMYPTVMSSVRSGLQSLIGLATGLGLGAAAILLHLPNFLGVVLVVAIGTVLAGLRVLGSGASWIPITGIFILLAGRRNPDDYSLSYLIDMGFGVAVGVAVNLLVVPPLFVRHATARLNSLRDDVADRLREAADLFADENRRYDELDATTDALGTTASAVHGHVHEAEESRKGNPRGRHDAKESEENYRRLRALEHIVFFVRDLVDVLGRVDAADSDPTASVAPVKVVRQHLAVTMVRVADLVASPVDAEDSPRLLATAQSSLDELMEAIDTTSGGQPSAVTNELAAAEALGRIIDSTRQFVAT